MNINTALGLGADEAKESSEVEIGRNISESERHQVEGSNPKVSPDELAALFRQLSDASTGEIEKLINQLQRLRTQLKNGADRIHRDIAGYVELSQQTMRLTSIIVDGVRKLPPGMPR